MAYYWVTEAQHYIQSLGFGVTRRPVNKESQDIRINQLGIDNSYSWDKHDVLRFGKGGVDDAEDAEVILHEYGHAIQDSQQPDGFGTSVEAGSIGEGFGDYWAATVSNVIAPTPDPACVADWDSVSYTSDEPHCLRRVDEDLHYPADLSGEVHHDGQIWSRALWDIRGASATSRRTRSSSRRSSRSRPTRPCRPRPGRPWPLRGASTGTPRPTPSAAHSRTGESSSSTEAMRGAARLRAAPRARRSSRRSPRAWPRWPASVRPCG